MSIAAPAPQIHVSPFIRVVLGITVLGVLQAIFTAAYEIVTLCLSPHEDGYGGIAIYGWRFAQREGATAMSSGVVLLAGSACVAVVCMSRSAGAFCAVQAVVVFSVVYYVYLLTIGPVSFFELRAFWTIHLLLCISHLTVAGYVLSNEGANKGKE